jgi:GH24 family phage-related lysozyme (muramidase)
MTLSKEALAMIRQLEGCQLAAYPDPGSGAEPWTIGYGHTGPEVGPGLVIDQQQAEVWLLADVAMAEKAVDQLLPEAGLNRWQREALVSFCFNVGAGALKASSLLRRLQAGEAADRVLSEELPRWVKGEQGPMAGLVRRRQLELAHSRRGETPIQLLDAVSHHRGLEHQIAAWQELQASLSREQLNAFARRYRQETATTAAATAAATAALPTAVPPTAAPSTAAPAPAATSLLQLPVPYHRQNDSRTSQGARMCFSSTCAMAAEFLRPGCLAGSGQADDRYLALVQRHGDTTDAQAQVAALAGLGIRARLRTDGRIGDLISQLQRRMPVPVGWLHKGPVAAATGGGHWSLVIGWDPQSQRLLMHDPNGEADLVNGGYVHTGSGKALRYSSSNWGRRWMVEGEGSGWWLELAIA